MWLKHGTGALLGVALAAGLLSGCSEGGGSKDRPGAQDLPAPVNLAKLTLPPAYDTGRGWDAVLGWLPKKVSSIPVTAVSSGSGGVGLLQAASGGYSVRLQDAATGKIRWSAKPWTPPPAVEGAEGAGSSAAEIPDVTSIEQGSREYVVAWAHAMQGKDELHEGREVVRLAVYPADAQGQAVTPLREISVPVSARPGQVHVGSSNGQLLVSWGGDGLYGTSAASVDVVTGKVTAYGQADALLPQCASTISCDGSTVIALSTGGPVVALGSGGFGVPGRWISSSTTPAGVKPTIGFVGALNGHAYGATRTHILASWRTGQYGDSTPVWTVHDTTNGHIEATMTCAAKEPDNPTSARTYPIISSPNGRYLAAGPVAFDLQQKKGVCLQGDGNRKTINIASISNNGTAYGAVEPTSPSAQDTPAMAQVDLSTGRPTLLKAGTDIPFAHIGNSGLMIRRNETDQLQICLRPLH